MIQLCSAISREWRKILKMSDMVLEKNVYPLTWHKNYKNTKVTFCAILFFFSFSPILCGIFIFYANKVCHRYLSFKMVYSLYIFIVNQSSNRFSSEIHLRTYSVTLISCYNLTALVYQTNQPPSNATTLFVVPGRSGTSGDPATQENYNNTGIVHMILLINHTAVRL